MPGEKHILVYLARHGSTDLNTSGCFRGPINAPLDTRGWNDANHLGYYFKPIDLAAIFHSDKQRTRETAAVVKREKEPEEHVDTFENHDLQALNVGDLAGQPKDKENLKIVGWHVDNPEVPLPGGESL